MQLNRYLALCGVASRRKANGIIASGRVEVNGQKVERLGVIVDPQKDKILMDRRELKLPERLRYILCNKPVGVITSVTDGRGRKTICDLIDVKERVFPVGRLDLDTEGALLLTNDGELAYRLAHPKFEIEKIYEAWVDGQVKKEEVQKFRKGIFIDEGILVRGEAIILDREQEKTRVQIRVHEGKKRQIKRMMRAVGHPVISLVRTRFAGLGVQGLKAGEWRELAQEEVRKLYKLTGLVSSQ